MASAPRGYYEPCQECSGQVIASKIGGMVKCVGCGLLQVGVRIPGVPKPELVKHEGIEYAEHDIVIPDLAEETIGWRAWGVSAAAADPQSGKQPLMHSVTYSAMFWPPREPVEATCTKNHDVPTEGCKCGLYSAKTRAHLMGLRNRYYAYNADLNGVFKVVGMVSNWGKVIEGTQGWRCTYSYPRKLYVPYEAWPLAKRLADTYGVPVELDNLLAGR